jgi:hypothetical protein
VCWDYVPYVEEIPLRGEVVHKEMDSLSGDDHQDGMKMLLLGKHSKAQECHNFFLMSTN